MSFMRRLRFIINLSSCYLPLFSALGLTVSRSGWLACRYRNTHNVDIAGAHGFAIQQLAIETAVSLFAIVQSYYIGPLQSHVQSFWKCSGCMPDA